MELLEAFPLFPGRYRGIFHSSPDAGIRGRAVFLYFCFFNDYIYYCEEVDFWRSGIWLGIFGVYNIDDKWCAVFLCGHFGSISGEGLYGGKKASNLYCAGKTVENNR